MKTYSSHYEGSNLKKCPKYTYNLSSYLKLTIIVYIIYNLYLFWRWYNKSYFKIYIFLQKKSCFFLYVQYQRSTKKHIFASNFCIIWSRTKRKNVWKSSDRVLSENQNLKKNSILNGLENLMNETLCEDFKTFFVFLLHNDPSSIFFWNFSVAVQARISNHKTHFFGQKK